VAADDRGSGFGDAIEHGEAFCGPVFTEEFGEGLAEGIRCFALDEELGGSFVDEEDGALDIADGEADGGFGFEEFAEYCVRVGGHCTTPFMAPYCSGHCTVDLLIVRP